MTLRTFSWAPVLTILWLVLIGVTVWLYAAAEVEPPVWDTLSYATKAMFFWDAVAHHHIFNPLNVPPTTRPPGTVLVSYPFGFTTAYAGQYFRSVFFPVILFSGAVYIAGSSREMPRSLPWLVFAMALTLGGMPHLYQFQHWGLVDSFIAGVAAVAAAATVRSIKTLSPWWVIVAALTAALCFMIKPAGLLVMALVGVSWLIMFGFRIGWRVSRLKQPEFARLLSIGLSGAAGIYVLTFAAVYFSQYMAAANIEYGTRALAVLQRDFSISINYAALSLLTFRSFGYVVPVLAGVGLLCALFTRGEIGAAIAAAVCLIVGTWFWIFETGLSQVRYFLPFGVMAFIFVTPSLLSRTRALPSWLQTVLAAVIVAPTLGVTLLLLYPQPPLEWQRLLNVNLSSGLYKEENQQALYFLDSVRGDGARSVYVLELNLSARGFAAVLEYRTVLNWPKPGARIVWPVDWVRTSTFRLQEIQKMDYVLFEPIHDETARNAILQSKTPNSFAAETRLMKAWFSTLGLADGVAVVSETRVRLLRIADHDLFGAALKRLRGEYDWRPVFREANP